MKKTLLLLIAVTGLFSTTNAQQTLSINGAIKDAKGLEIEGATVFIAGSQKITATDLKGTFRFLNLASGTYQVVINRIGFTPIKRNFLLTDRAVTLDTVMQEAQITLDEVVIGDNSQRKNFLKTFNKYFMGESDNAKSCTILNPEKIDFSTKNKLLKANTLDFLVIENKNLGYKIKYLLRNFQYDSGIDATFYDGESIFENMEGSAEQQAVWDANRKKAYEGSLMHYLRALYANRTREEGFLTYMILNLNMPLVINPNPVFPEQLIKHTDSNFISFRYKKRLYTLYDKKKAAAEQKLTTRKDMVIDMASTGSVLMLDAAIDRQGSYSDHKTILIQGHWGRKRLADQLPMEYQPN